jgi:uncharacterized protein (DUF433 family)
MNRTNLLNRISTIPGVCGGKPCVKGTRIEISIILDSLAEGLTPEEIIDHYPSLKIDDVRAVLAYASELANEEIWKVHAS